MGIGFRNGAEGLGFRFRDSVSGYGVYKGLVGLLYPKRSPFKLLNVAHKGVFRPNPPKADNVWDFRALGWNPRVQFYVCFNNL